ncbi:MAG: hypothetical protein NVS4B8_08750 [Herpetosiphon sp.]
MPNVQPTLEEVTAALVAVQCILQARAIAPAKSAASKWKDSIKIMDQRLPAVRVDRPATWATVERLRRL